MPEIGAVLNASKIMVATVQSSFGLAAQPFAPP
jgi:hypothetical protein